jgi:hypothetical protein
MNKLVIFFILMVAVALSLYIKEDSTIAYFTAIYNAIMSGVFYKD